MPLLRRAFAAAAILWALALPAATFLASRPQVAAAAYAAAFAAYGLGAVICHQRPERSMYLWGAQMPVCARCTGIYAGAAVAALMMSFRTAKAVRHISQVFVPQPWTDVAQGFSPAHHLVLAALPALVTLAYEWTTGVTPSNGIRAASGAPLGAVVAILITAVGRGRST